MITKKTLLYIFAPFFKVGVVVYPLLFFLTKILKNCYSYYHWFVILIVMVMYSIFIQENNLILKRKTNYEVISAKKTNEKCWTYISRAVRGIFRL